MKQFDFATNYSQDAPLGNLSPAILPDNGDVNDRRRLVLNSLTEKACGSSSNNKVHSFEYYDINALPRRISLAQDHWGYYNGKDSNTDLDPGMPYYKQPCNDCEDEYDHICSERPNKREPVFPAMRNGTLKKINFPTGGSSLLDFEAHTSWTDDSTCTSATLLDWSAFGGGNCSNCTNCSSAFSEQTYSFSQNQINTGHLSISIGNGCMSNSASIEVYNPSNQLITSVSGNGYWRLTNLGGVSLQVGINYRFKLIMQGSQPAFAKVYTLTRTYFKANTIVGGLRIKTITTNDGDNDPSNNIVKNFEYNDPVIQGRSSGKLVHFPQYVAVFDVACTHSGDPDCDLPNCNWPLSNEYQYPESCPSFSTEIKVFLLSHNSALQPMQTTMGSHIGYTGVQVKETNNGKIEYKYNMGQYENGPWKPKGYPFPPAPYDPFVGKLLYETHYSQAGAPQKTM